MIGGANRWTDFVKKWASDNDTTYGCALSKPECSQAYRAKYGNRKKLSQKKERELMGAEDKDAPAPPEPDYGDDGGDGGDDGPPPPKKKGRPKKYETEAEAKRAKSQKTMEAKKRRQQEKKDAKADPKEAEAMGAEDKDAPVRYLAEIKRLAKMGPSARPRVKELSVVFNSGGMNEKEMDAFEALAEQFKKPMAPPSSPPPISAEKVAEVKESKASKLQKQRDLMKALRDKRKSEGRSATGKTLMNPQQMALNKAIVAEGEGIEPIRLEMMEIAEPTVSTKISPNITIAPPRKLVAPEPTAPKGKPRKWKKDELKNNFANWLSWTKGKKISNIDKASLPELTELYTRYNVTPEQVEAEVMAERAKRSEEKSRVEATRDSPESIEYEGQTLVKMTKQLNDVGAHFPNDIDVYKSADGTFYERDQLKKGVVESRPNNQYTMNRLLNREKTPAPAPAPAPEAKSSGKESRWAEDSDNFGGSNATISKAKDKFGAQWLFSGDDYFYGVKKDGEYYRFKYDEYPEPRKQSEKFYDDAKEWVYKERARQKTEEVLPNSGIHRHLPNEKDWLWDKYLSGKTGRGYDDMEGGKFDIFDDLIIPVGTKVGEPFKQTTGLNPFTLGFKLGQDVIAPALMKRFPPRGGHWTSTEVSHLEKEMRNYQNIAHHLGQHLAESGSQDPKDQIGYYHFSKEAERIGELIDQIRS